MKLVVQRVSSSRVVVGGETVGEIKQGAMVLFCAEQSDSSGDHPLADKLVKLRIFSDDNQKMNLSMLDLPHLDLLIVPQFTLAADCRKGNRPSFQNAAQPETGLRIFNEFKQKCEQLLGKPVAQGEFGADMQVHLCNDGPATFILEG